MYKQNRGFSLIELLIVVTIIGILAAFAFPAYQNHIEASKRSAAQQFMMSLASKEEQYLLENRSYATGTNALALLQVSMDSEPTVDENYTITIRPITGVTTSYKISAAPKSGSSMDGTDTLSLDSRGEVEPADLWE